MRALIKTLQRHFQFSSLFKGLPPDRWYLGGPPGMNRHTDEVCEPISSHHCIDRHDARELLNPDAAQLQRSAKIELTQRQNPVRLIVRPCIERGNPRVER